MNYWSLRHKAIGSTSHELRTLIAPYGYVGSTISAEPKYEADMSYISSAQARSKPVTQSGATTDSFT